MEKRIKLNNQIGLAAKGTVFVRGLFDVPNSYQSSHTRDNFYWQEWSSLEDNSFLMDSWITKEDYSDL